jgi:hypothetical protein
MVVLVPTFMVAIRIYREDLFRVITSHNQLGLSILKCIRHGLVAKINDKRKSWIYEALGQISADHSRARHTPLPRPAMAHEASAYVLLHFFSTSHTCNIENNSSYK